MSKQEVKRKLRVQINAFKRKYNLNKKEKKQFAEMLQVAVNWSSATTEQKDAYYAYLMR